MTVAFVSGTGCDLPFAGPFQGRVTDATSGKPIYDARVEAEWWCHDNPLPDGPGSFFVRSTVVTDRKGMFRLPKETRRGGLFGSDFALKIRAKGYIPATLLGDTTGNPLPPQTVTYPFIRTTLHRRFPHLLDVKLVPAAPVLIKAIRSGSPSHQRTAREELTKLVGADFGYDADKWSKAIAIMHGRSGGMPKGGISSKPAGCPCQESLKKGRGSREVRRRERLLLRASATGDLQQVRSLLASGLDANARNHACRTPLMKAVYSNNSELIEFLLSEGADVNSRDNHCRTALMKAASGNRTRVLELLLSRGAQINAQDAEGITALMLAAQLGNVESVHTLLSKGADVHLKDRSGETAWFKAATIKCKEVMDILDSHGAKH